MQTIKLEIKTFGGSVLFSYKSKDNTILKTLQEAVKLKKDLRGAYLRGAYLTGADLRGAYLRGAYLTGADLRGAYLTGADLRGADLTGADLTGADLTGADLTGAIDIEHTERHKQCMQNILYILSYTKGEVKFLKEKLLAGEVSGTQYTGNCCCLIGTLSKSFSEDKTYKFCSVIPFYTKGIHNLGEQRFYQIKKGDTDTIFVKEAVKCCDIILSQK